jgi:hypothetical protein
VVHISRVGSGTGMLKKKTPDCPMKDIAFVYHTQCIEQLKYSRIFTPSLVWWSGDSLQPEEQRHIGKGRKR